MLRGVVGPVRTFAFAAASLVVFTHLLPEAVSEIGFSALVVFGASLALPAALERLAHARHGQAHLHGEHADDHAPGLEIGYLGLLLHNFGDGLGIGALPSSWARTEIALSVAAHTIPVVAIFVVAFASQRSTRAALVRAVFLALAIAAGMVAASLVPEWFTGALEPWITAAIAGVLLHVIAHDWPAEPAPDASSRALDLVAIAAALGLAFARPESGVEAHAAAEVPERLVASMARLALGIGPALLAGLAASAALGALVEGLRSGRLPAPAGSAPVEAARGLGLAATEPAAAASALARAEAMRRSGGPAARVVAFLTGLRGLGLETLFVGAALLGTRWSLARLAGTVLVAFAAGLAAAATAAPSGGEGAAGTTDGGGTSAASSFGRRFVDHLDDLVAHCGAWTIVGLLAACYVELALPAAGFAASPLAAAVAWLLAAAAAVAWIGAIATLPLAAVLVHAGWPREAALATLLLGPTIGLAGSRWIRNRFGARSAAASLGAMAAAAVAWSFAAGAAGLLPGTSDPVVDAPAAGLAARLSLAALAGLLGRSVWRSGLRNWLSRLGEAPSIAIAPGEAIGAAHRHDATEGRHGHRAHATAHRHPGDGRTRRR